MTVSGGDILPVLSDVVSEVAGTTPDTVQAIADKLEVTNTLLLGINDRLDFIIALGVAIVFVAVCYSILKSFSRF